MRQGGTEAEWDRKEQGGTGCRTQSVRHQLTIPLPSWTQSSQGRRSPSHRHTEIHDFIDYIPPTGSADDLRIDTQIHSTPAPFSNPRSAPSPLHLQSVLTDPTLQHQLRCLGADLNALSSDLNDAMALAAVHPSQSVSALRRGSERRFMYCAGYRAAGAPGAAAAARPLVAEMEAEV